MKQEQKIKELEDRIEVLETIEWVRTNPKPDMEIIQSQLTGFKVSCYPGKTSLGRQWVVCMEDRINRDNKYEVPLYDLQVIHGIKVK